MARSLSILLLIGCTICFATSTSEACWRCRHAGQASGGYGYSGVQAVQGVQTVQTVQAVPTFSAVAAMPMVVAASPLAVQSYGGVQVAGTTTQGTCGISSSEVADVQTSVADIKAEIQSIRGEFLGTIFRDLLLPIANELIRSRLDLPKQGEQQCGSGATGTVDPRTGVPQPGGPFGPTAVASAPPEDMARLLAKLEELVDLLKAEHGGEGGHEGEEGHACEKCRKCEKCQGEAGGDAEQLPSGDKVSGRNSRSGRLVGHRSPNEQRAAPFSWDEKLQRLEAKNEQLRQRLEAVLRD